MHLQQEKILPKYIPMSVTKIEKNAFKNCKKLTIYCEKNSYSYDYAKKNKNKTFVE